jgi:hypothetical protein
MAEGIQGSFGDSPGKVSFAAYWKLDDPKSEFWPALQSVLSMGGTFLRQGGKRMFCAPYVFSQFPSELDPMKFLVVVHQDAALRAEPSLKSPVVRTTSYELVEAIGQDPLNGAAWVHVKTSAGEKGYLPRDAVRSPLEARACFVFKGGRWLIASFVRGD